MTSLSSWPSVPPCLDSLATHTIFSGHPPSLLFTWLLGNATIMPPDSDLGSSLK